MKIARDFSMHIEGSSLPDVKTLIALLCQFELEQLLNKPTHSNGGCLDLIITREDVSVMPKYIYTYTIVSYLLPSSKTIYILGKVCNRKKFNELILSWPSIKSFVPKSRKPCLYSCQNPIWTIWLNNESYLKLSSLQHERLRSVINLCHKGLTQNIQHVNAVLESMTAN